MRLAERIIAAMTVRSPQPFWLRAISVQFGFNVMKNPEENSLRLNYFQPCFSHQLQRLSIPVTPELFRNPIGRAVLKSRKPFAIASAMLQQKDSPCRPTNSLNFFERRHGI